MANKKEVKQHINSVSDIRTITNAMYLIASTKLRRAKANLDGVRPYFYALKKSMHTLAADSQAKKSKYFRTEGASKGIVVVTADRGLAGAYNYNVIRKVLPILQEDPDAVVFPIGGYGRQYFLKHGYNVYKDFLYSSESSALRTARRIGAFLLDLYDRNDLKEILVVYTDFKGNMESKVEVKKLLPFESEGTEPANFFFPSVQEVMKGIVPEYVTGYLFSAITDSFCSEQNARMTAMDAANRNAEKLLEELSVTYDHIRQNTITQEIIEISTGVGKQRKKGESAL